MQFSFTLRRYQLRVISAASTNLFAGWFLAIFATENIFVLTVDILAAIVSLYLALKIEKILEEFYES